MGFIKLPKIKTIKITVTTEEKEFKLDIKIIAIKLS